MDQDWSAIDPADPGCARPGIVASDAFVFQID
jgi:hypothetical protein